MEYTKESLQNTWGVAESKEHAEYIVELCKMNGIKVFNGFDVGITNFVIVKNEVIFTYGKPSVSEHDKQITIPLPTPLPLKEKEWPQVGDDVSLDCSVGEMSGRLLALTREYAIISQGDTEQHLHLSKWRLVKPKTPEELLIEELHQKLLANNCSDEYLLACDIVQGKIEGLSYE